MRFKFHFWSVIIVLFYVRDLKLKFHFWSVITIINILKYTHIPCWKLIISGWQKALLKHEHIKLESPEVGLVFEARNCLIHCLLPQPKKDDALDANLSVGGNFFDGPFLHYQDDQELPLLQWTDRHLLLHPHCHLLRLQKHLHKRDGRFHPDVEYGYVHRVLVLYKKHCHYKTILNGFACSS